MAKRPTKQRQPRQRGHSWVIYHIKGTPAKLVGIIDDASDEHTAIARAIEQYKASRRYEILKLRTDAVLGFGHGVCQRWGQNGIAVNDSIMSGLMVWGKTVDE